jgi:hypothetical protein
VAGSAIFGDREGVTAAMACLQTVTVHAKNERDPAELNGLQAATRAALGF